MTKHPHRKATNPHKRSAVKRASSDVCWIICQNGQIRVVDIAEAQLTALSYSPDTAHLLNAAPEFASQASHFISA